MAYRVQTEWRRCYKCNGLYLAANGGGACPAGGPHEKLDSPDYAVFLGETPAGTQGGWRYCHKCLGLYFGSGDHQGTCPAGGEHNPATQNNYSVVARDDRGEDSKLMQSGWRFCKNCYALFYAMSNNGRCPVTGLLGHENTPTYYMLGHGSDYANLMNAAIGPLNSADRAVALSLTDVLADAGQKIGEKLIDWVVKEGVDRVLEKTGLKAMFRDFLDRLFGGHSPGGDHDHDHDHDHPNPGGNGGGGGGNPRIREPERN